MTIEMITIKLNDEFYTVEKNTTLTNLLKQFGYVIGNYAVMRNQYFVPSTHYAMTELCENDVIQIIVPMQGG